MGRTKNPPEAAASAQISVSNKKSHHHQTLADDPSRKPNKLQQTHVNAPKTEDPDHVDTDKTLKVPRASSPSIDVTDDKMKQQEEYAKASIIMYRLAMRKYHLPGNNLCQDLLMYIQNNHPVFSIFCYHKLHPLRLGQRILLLLGSIAFGLIVTSFTTLYFVYARKDMNTALVCIKLWEKTSGTLGSVMTNVDASQTEQCRFKITWGMFTLWTLGGLVHTLFDQTLWFMSACCCCLPGAICGNRRRLRKVGSFAVLFIVAIVIAIATFGVILRAKYEARKAEKLAGVSTNWHDPESFSFVLGFIVLQLLVWFVHYFIFAAILFSGILVCGKVPIIGGRPYEMAEEKRQLEREKRKHQELSSTATVSMSADESDSRTTPRMTYIRTNSNEQDIELFCDLEADLDTQDYIATDTKEIETQKHMVPVLDTQQKKRRLPQDRASRKKHHEQDCSNCDVAITRKASF